MKPERLTTKELSDIIMSELEFGDIRKCEIDKKLRGKIGLDQSQYVLSKLRKQGKIKLIKDKRGYRKYD